MVPNQFTDVAERKRRRGSERLDWSRRDLQYYWSMPENRLWSFGLELESGTPLRRGASRKFYKERDVVN